MRLILVSALVVLAAARIKLPTYWTGAFWPEKTTTTTTPVPPSPRSFIVQQTVTYKHTIYESKEDVEEGSGEENSTKPYDAYGNLVRAVELMNKSSVVPPTVSTTTSTTPIPDEDNHFLWRERQERRMADLFRGNPHHDNRMEMVIARRKAREESGVMKPGYVDTADEITKGYEQATLHHPVQYVFVAVEGIQRRRAEYERALKEIEEEELIEADFIKWQKENDARNERRRAYLEMKRQKELLEKYPARQVKIEEEDHELDGYYEEMHMPHPPPLYLSVKNLFRRKAPSTTRDPTDGMPASFMCC